MPTRPTCSFPRRRRPTDRGRGCDGCATTFVRAMHGKRWLRSPPGRRRYGGVPGILGGRNAPSLPTSASRALPHLICEDIVMGSHPAAAPGKGPLAAAPGTRDVGDVSAIGSPEEPLLSSVRTGDQRPGGSGGRRLPCAVTARPPGGGKGESVHRRGGRGAGGHAGSRARRVGKPLPLCRRERRGAVLDPV